MEASMKYGIGWIVGIALLLGACGDDEESGLIPVTFQSKWFPQAQFIGYYAAGGHPPGVGTSADAPLEGGLNFYAAEGLDVTVLDGGSVNPSTEVAMGNADLGTDWIANMVQAIEVNNFDLRHLAQIFQRPGYEFVALQSSGLDSVDDFRGETVGVWDFGNEFPAQVCFAQFNLTSDLDDNLPVGQDPDVVTETYNFDPALVFPVPGGSAGTVEVASAMVYNELNQIIGLGYQESELSRISAADAGCGLLEDFIFATAAMLNEPNFKGSGVSGQEVAVRFVRATIKGWAWAIDQANEEQALDLVLPYCGDTCNNGPDSSISQREHQRWQLQRVSELVQPGLLSGGTNRTLGCLNGTEFDETLTRLRSVGLIREGTGTGILAPEILTAAGTTCPQ